MKWKFLGFVAILFCASCGDAKNLPSFIKKCKLNNPDINQCLIDRTKELKPYLSKGIPEMKLPSLDPLLVEKVELVTGEGTATEFRASFVDVIVDGSNDFEVKELDFNLADNKIFLHIYIPKLRMRLTYNFKGRLLVLQLDSTGPADSNITEIHSKSLTNTKIVKKNGQDYLVLSHRPAVITYNKPSLRFENLFRGNQELTDHTNRIINENIDEMAKDIRPLIDNTIEVFVSGIIDKVFQTYSLQELFD